MSPDIVLIILISLLSALFVVLPFFRFADEQFVIPENWKRKDKAERAAQLQRDLELDFETGKVSEEEFKRMSKQLS